MKTLKGACGYLLISVVADMIVGFTSGRPMNGDGKKVGTEKKLMNLHMIISTK